MTGFRFLATAAVAAAALSSVSAQATVFNFSITNSSSAVLASGSITTSNTLNVLNGYDVLAISGTVAGYGAITGLVPTSAPATITNGYGFSYNNVVYSNSALAVDWYGLLFTTGSPSTPAYWNVYHDAGQDWLYGNIPGTGYLPATGTVAISPVPEPSTWAMLLCGFAVAGAAMRSRSKPKVRVRLNLA